MPLRSAALALRIAPRAPPGRSGADTGKRGNHGSELAAANEAAGTRHRNRAGTRLADQPGFARVTGARGDDRPDTGEGRHDEPVDHAATGRAVHDLSGRADAVR